jgi:GT2 family glycosyltransferase
MHDLVPVSVVIPNFNGASLLERNLPSVLEALQHYPGDGEVIVVDDGSSDASLEVLQTRFPEVRCLIHPQNRGFSEAVLTGVREAKTEAIVLLNSDVQPDEGFLLPLLVRLREPQVFSVQSAIRVNGPDPHPLCLTRFAYRWGALKRLETLRLGSEPWLCLYASGGSMAVKRSMFLDFEGFLPLLKPFYWEDFELGLRAWRSGLETWLVPTSLVWHQEQGTIRDHVKKQRIRFALQRNKLLVEWIHYPALALVLFGVPKLIGRILGRLLVGDVGYLRVVASALRDMSTVLSLRKALKASEALTFKEVLDRIARENATHDRSSCETTSRGKHAEGP